MWKNISYGIFTTVCIVYFIAYLLKCFQKGPGYNFEPKHQNSKRKKASDPVNAIECKAFQHCLKISDFDIYDFFLDNKDPVMQIPQLQATSEKRLFLF